MAGEKKLLTSTLRVTLNGTELIGYSDFMEFEPSLDHSEVIQETRALRAAAAKLANRGGASRTLRFSRCIKHADFDAATAAMFLFSRTVQGLAGTCVVNFNADGDSNTYNNAVITGLQGRIKWGWTFHTITIRGGADAAS